LSPSLNKNIIATITYYDVLDLPLTAFEIWKHMIVHEGQGRSERYSLGEVVEALGSEALVRRLGHENGFYFLPARGHLVSDRIQREKLSGEKLRRMRRLARVMSFLPYVRMIAATGSLGFKHGKKESDWDMLIVFQPGKMWIARTLLTGFLQAIGKRRHGTKITDRACLNYFVTEDNLEILVQDLYSAHEYASLIPLFGRKTFERFELAQAWIRDLKPAYAPTLAMHALLLPESRTQARVQGMFEAFWNLFPLEGFLSRAQKRRIERNPKTKLSGSLIEASDQALIFLPKPRGPRVYERFKERLSF
jgi:hypothetical protein